MSTLEKNEIIEALKAHLETQNDMNFELKKKIDDLVNKVEPVCEFYSNLQGASNVLKWLVGLATVGIGLYLSFKEETKKQNEDNENLRKEARERLKKILSK